MSGDGGDTGGGGDKGSGGSDSGGGGGLSASNYTQMTPNYEPPTSSVGSDPLGFSSSPGEQAGFQGSAELPPEISTGSSGGGGGLDTGGGSAGAGSGVDLSPWSAPSINDFVSPSGGGFNLAGSGPVGGDSGPIGVDSGPAIHGGVFSTDPNPTPLAQDTSSLGATAPSGGAGGSAMAFSAPAGVSGTPQLDSLVANPDNSNPLATMSPSDRSIFDSLNGAQTAAVNEYADARSPSIPSADSTGSTTLPATTGDSAKGGGSGGSGGNSQTTGILPNISNNSLGVAAAGAGLLNNLINGNRTTPAVAALQGQAATNNANSQVLIDKGLTQGSTFGTPALQSGQDQTAKGAALQQYVATGTLPQGYEDQVQQGVSAAKQNIISNYANRGLPTDPTKNSSLAQELAQVDSRVPAMREQLAAQLAQSGNSIVASGNNTSSTGNALTGNALVSDGLQAAGVSSSVYQTLANLENSQNQQKSAAIANFASALNGGNKGVTLNLGNSTPATP